MAQYINKSALLAEIEKRINFNETLNAHSRLDECNAILSFVDTLEVKEVNLEKEFSKWWKGERAKDYNVDTLYERYSKTSLKLAKHFFELGLKAQKVI